MLTVRLLKVLQPLDPDEARGRVIDQAKVYLADLRNKSLEIFPCCAV